MGSNTSKTSTEPVGLVQKPEVDADGNPDPRSPTPEISRTPLQNKNSSKHNITKNVDLRKTFENSKGEEKLIHNNPILSAVIKSHLQYYDPRSPTQDFERTPIVIGRDIEEDEKRIQMDSCGSPNLNNESNEHDNSCMETKEMIPDLIVPKNLCNGFLDLTLADSIEETEEPLGSSTASNDTIEKNMTNDSGVKPVQFLETNFDYVEQPNATEVEIGQSKDYLTSLTKFKILYDDPRSPSVGIERTPIVVAKIEEENNVEDMSDDTLIKVLQSTNAELRQTAKTQEVTPDGLLIYVDESTALNDTPKKSKSASNSGSRTPLSCMKNKTDTDNAQSKSSNDPKVQNKASKIPRRVSHIPRLKALATTTKISPSVSSGSLKSISKTSVIGGDCENTPPHSHRDIWDKDTSIVL